MSILCYSTCISASASENDVLTGSDLTKSCRVNPMLSCKGLGELSTQKKSLSLALEANVCILDHGDDFNVEAFSYQRL